MDQIENRKGGPKLSEGRKIGNQEIRLQIKGGVRRRWGCQKGKKVKESIHPDALHKKNPSGTAGNKVFLYTLSPTS